MRFGLFASVVLHLAIVGAGFILPQFITLPDVTSEPYIPLDLIAEAELDLTTSVPAAAPEPVEEEEPDPDLPEPQVEEPEPAPAEEAAPELPAVGTGHGPGAPRARRGLDARGARPRQPVPDAADA